jgi:hypothetical protein
MMAPPPKNRDDDSAPMPLAAVALAKSMDFKIPVWGVLSLLAALAYWLITMNMQQQQILATMAELKIAVNAGNNLGAANAGQIAILQFRQERVEAELARLGAPALPHKNGRE